ncbi:chemotaxis protein [Thiobacillus sedimenti]|uniref:Chemotaxis protein n=1 Tax=Thiobacillus sedimenti TaxID=3110231 RepID=A0ABZ1CLT3_9PROT|nr:chemotaxis protein [Thiobacillus sp. SCUT-2]WRS40237.1 chemotaxis protein [Thiobacillus sp. SCUT-2]
MLPREAPPDESMNAQVLRLLSGVSAHGDQHLAEVERDLVQMDVLLQEAIKKLCASFLAIHQSLDQQQAAIREVLAGAPEQAARLEALRDAVNEHIGAAVTGLQFQDMTSQLIGRMARHLAGLRDVFGALAGDGEDAMPQSGSTEMVTTLDRLSERVGARCSEMAVSVRSTVNQRHMESGDVELF